MTDVVVLFVLALAIDLSIASWLWIKVRGRHKRSLGSGQVTEDHRMIWSPSLGAYIPAPRISEAFDPKSAEFDG